MKSVGIKTLKNQPSRYLRAVRGGESVFVTDRGEVIAEIRSPNPPVRPSRWEFWMAAQAREGRMRRAAGSEPIRWKDFASKTPSVRIDPQQTLHEAREERL